MALQRYQWVRMSVLSSLLVSLKWLAPPTLKALLSNLTMAYLWYAESILMPFSQDAMIFIMVIVMLFDDWMLEPALK